MLSFRSTVRFAVIGVLSLVLLSGCDEGSASSGNGGTQRQPDSSVITKAKADDAGSASDARTGAPGAKKAITLPGTGRYVIGTAAPYGGYQLAGKPDTQPAGCLWSVQDADGKVRFANQGTFVFLTDVPEYVTFVTDGCPGWEKFE